MRCPQDGESEEFPFSRYLYCYKSFHSPLLDRDYPGLSLAQLEAAASRENSRKQDQRQAGGLALCRPDLHRYREKTTLREGHHYGLFFVESYYYGFHTCLAQN